MDFVTALLLIGTSEDACAIVGGENQGPYTRIIETPFDMPVYRVEEKVNYSANKRTSDEVSASTHHTLSLTEVGANNSSAIATISAYTPTKLEGGEMASFAT